MRRLLLNLKRLSFSQKLVIITLIIIIAISSLYFSYLSTQKKISSCKFLYEQGILSHSAQEGLNKLRELRSNGAKQEALDNYWYTLDDATKKAIANILKLTDKNTDLSKVSSECSKLLLNP